MGLFLEAQGLGRVTLAFEKGVEAPKGQAGQGTGRVSLDFPPGGHAG